MARTRFFGPVSTVVVRPLIAAVSIAMAGLSVACSADVVEPNLSRDEFTGSYELAELRFDPDGVLAAVDVRAIVLERGKSTGVLTLLSDGRLQYLYDDPFSDLVRLANGTFRTTPTGVELRFSGASSVGELLLPSRLLAQRDASGSLVVDTGGVFADRATLVRLEPLYESEPLVDPVPGRLTVRFSPEGGAP